jgi:hypothetical protein
MVYLTDEEVELFCEIKGNIITYNGEQYKICRVTNDGYYINKLIK